MNATNHHLSYEFYFLLQKNVDSKQEPRSLSANQSNRIMQEGIPIDSDKRLFRSKPFASPHLSDDELLHIEPLEDWADNLKTGWEKIQHVYTEHFSHQEVNATEAQDFCRQALMGVALLINDARVNSHKITASLRGTANQVVFKPDIGLFQVNYTPPDNKGIAATAILNIFEPQFQAIQEDQHWQLQLDLPVPQLVPIEMTKNSANPTIAPNPIFAVYGLAHGDLEEIGEKALQDFLISDEPAILVRVLPRLLIRQWQLTRMDFAAIQVRQHLQSCSKEHYQTNLPCLSNRQLSDSLQTMAMVNAETSLLLGKLHQAIKTLEIHHNNTKRWLRRARQYSPDWEVVWQHDDESPLLSRFDADKQKLQNHITYIQGEITYLEGIRQHWHLHFEGRQLAWSEWLSRLGSVLAFLVAVGAASLTAVGIQNTPPADNGSFLSPLIHFFDDLQKTPVFADMNYLLSQPIVYWLLIIVLLIPVFLHLVQTLRRKVRCSRLWRWGIGMVLLSPAFLFLIHQIVINL